MAIGAPTFGVVTRGFNNLTPVAPSFSAGKTIVAFTGEHFGTDVLSGAPGSPWVECDANANAPGVRAFALYSTTGAEAMPTFNWGAINRAWAVVAVFSGGDPGLGSGFAAADRGVNHTTSIFGPASSRTPTLNGCINFLFGGKNKTSASDATNFSAPSGFTIGVSDVVSGSNDAAVAIAYQIQTTATTVAANQALTGSVADATTQTSQGCLFSLEPAGGAALAATPAASASATGALTTGSLSGSATAAAAGAGSLLTAIRMAVAASVGSTLTSGLTNWSTVTLAGTQYTGPGGLHDATLIAQGWDPPVGAVIYWDATNATCYSNGEISAITNNCSFVVQYNDGTTFRTAVIIITPQMVSAANVGAAAAASLTTAIRLAVGAVSVANATGQLTAAIRLAGSAASVANAAATMITGIQLNAASVATGAATGALTGGQSSLQATASALSNALGSLSAKIQFAGAIVATSTVAGALATQIQLAGATAALSNAGADLQVAIRLAGDAVVGASAAGSALITSSLSSAAHAVSTATGALFTALRFAGQAFVSSSAQADLSTGVSLAGAAEVDTQAAITPVGAEGQFGRADINVLSPTGFPTALAVFIEGSTAITTIAYFNTKGLPFVPARIQWTVIDLNSGIVIVPYTDVGTVELSNAVTISGDKNVMINQSRSSEQHEILFKIIDNLGQTNYARGIFEILSTNIGLN